MGWFHRNVIVGLGGMTLLAVLLAIGLAATRSVEEGADTIVWLATLPSGGPNGQFFRDRRVIAW